MILILRTIFNVKKNVKNVCDAKQIRKKISNCIILILRIKFNIKKKLKNVCDAKRMKKISNCIDC